MAPEKPHAWVARVHAAGSDCCRQGGLFITPISGDEKSRIKALADWESGEGSLLPWFIEGHLLPGSSYHGEGEGLSRVTQSIHEDPPP